MHEGARIPYLNNKASLLTMNYLGGVRVVPSYNTSGMIGQISYEDCGVSQTAVAMVETGS